MMLSIFSCAHWPSVCFLWKSVYLGLLPIFTTGCLPFSGTELYKLLILWIRACMLLLQLCPTFCCSVDSSLPSSSVHGILQARILEWVAMTSSRGSSQHKDWTRVSCVFCIADRFFTAKPLGKPYILEIKTLSDIICKYFLLFTRLFFHFIDSLTCSAKLLIVSHFFILLFFLPFLEADAENYC